MSRFSVLSFIAIFIFLVAPSAYCLLAVAISDGNLPIGPIATKEVCGVSKGCLRLGTDTCNQDECSILVTYRYNATASPAQIAVEMAAYVGQMNQSVPAIALLVSDDQSQGSDYALICFYDAANVGYVAVTTGYTANAPAPNPPLIVLRDEQAQLGISGVEGFYNPISSRLYCRFTKTAVSSKSNNNPYVKSLAPGNSYYFLIGTSFLKADSSGQTTGQTTAKLTLNAQEDPGHFSNVDPAAISAERKGVHWLYKFHGILMLIAWTVCAGIAIILARYYRFTLPFSQGRLGVRIWFQMHRALQIAATILVIIGFILIFIKADWNYASGLQGLQAAHPIVGIIITIFVIINLTLGFFRPNELSQWRPFFNWFHWGFGTLAHCLAVFNILIGVTMEDVSMPPWTWWLLVIFFIFHIIVEIALEIHTWVVWYRMRKDHTEREKLVRMGTETGTTMHVVLANDRPTYLSHSLFRQVIIWVYIPVAIIVTFIELIMLATR